MLITRDEDGTKEFKRSVEHLRGQEMVGLSNLLLSSCVQDRILLIPLSVVV